MAAKRFLITGGSQGIGAALVAQARKGGDEVVFTGRNERLVEQVAKETGAHGLRADVSVGDDNAKAVDLCRQRLGGIDVLINNAGYGYTAEIGALDVDAMRTLFGTNVFGMVDMANRVVPLMKAQASGDIVNIASTSGTKGSQGGTSYAAANGRFEESLSVGRRSFGRTVFASFRCVPRKCRRIGGGKVRERNNPNKLIAEDIAKAILSSLNMPRRVLFPEFSIFATNPWKED